MTDYTKLMAKVRSKRWRLNQKYCFLINDGKTEEALKLRDEIDSLGKELHNLKMGISLK